MFFLQVNRPISMKKDGIQTRKRKPKGQGKARASPKVAAQQRQNNTSPGEYYFIPFLYAHKNSVDLYKNKKNKYEYIPEHAFYERDFVRTKNVLSVI